MQQLLISEDLGDRKPTAHLLRMQQFPGDKGDTFDASILREMLLQRLPQDIYMIRFTADSCSLAGLARMADKIVEVKLFALFEL